MGVRTWVYVGSLATLLAVIGGLFLLRGDSSSSELDTSEIELVIAEDGSARVIVGLASPADDGDARERDQAAVASLLRGTDSVVLTKYPLEPAIVALVDEDGLERLAKSSLVVSIILDVEAGSAYQ